jgi:antitoxin HicB
MVATAKKTQRTAEDYTKLPYRMEVYWDQDYWAVEFPELPGLVAGNETWEGLDAVVDDAKRTWFESMIEDGKPIPEPRSLDEQFSGKLVARLPKSLHRRAAWVAEKEGVSLNTFIVSAVSAAVVGASAQSGKKT